MDPIDKVMKIKLWQRACRLDLEIVELENVWTARYNELYSVAPLVKPKHLSNIEEKLRVARAKLASIMLHKEFNYDYRQLPSYQAPVM